MAKLVDAADLGSAAVRRTGSTPVSRTGVKVKYEELIESIDYRRRPKRLIPTGGLEEIGPTRLKLNFPDFCNLLNP